MDVQGPGLSPFGFHLFWLLTVLFVVSVLTLTVIVLAVRASSRTTYPIRTLGTQMGAVATPAARETPLEILARRFASGEITADEYERGRDLLGGGGKT
ncbi:MAG: SHOCT domain-containing protein [Candidatus Dormibacteraceae bacterium]